MRVAIAVEGEVTTRAAQSLSAHPGIEVVLLAPSTSSQFQVVDTPDGCTAVFGEAEAGRVGVAHGIPAVVTGASDAAAGVSWASIRGLALALAADLDDVEAVAVGVPGDPGGTETVVFPSPIDGRAAERETVNGRTVLVGRGDGPLAAALALGRSRHRVIVDDHRFMEAVALAAGIAVLDPVGSVPVWERPGPYLHTAAAMGLVIGERVPT